MKTFKEIKSLTEVKSLAKEYTDSIVAAIKAGQLRNRGVRGNLRRAYLQGYMQSLQDLGLLNEADKDGTDE